MPVVESEVHVAASRDAVYAVAKDVESFPTYMPDVESIELESREATDSGTRLVTRWIAVVPEFKLKVRWTEEDVWDDGEYVCRFRQLKGDYQLYEGEWRFLEENGGTLFRSTIRYDLEVPLIGALLKNLIARKMRDNSERILGAIKQRAQEHAPRASG